MMRRDARSFVLGGFIEVRTGATLEIASRCPAGNVTHGTGKRPS